MGDLSAHFSRSEFTCPGVKLKGHPPHPVVVDPRLVASLERLRAARGGRALRIVTGHRCAWYERHKGRTGQSQHVLGRAADIPGGYCTEPQAEAAGFQGIGESGPWAVHVDVRPTRARWRY